MTNRLLSLGVAVASASACAAEPPSHLARFQAEARPVLAKYCYECHAGERTEADLDLSRFVDAASARQAVPLWRKVGEMLDTGQMPPKDAKRHPTPMEHAALRGWVHGLLKSVAAETAGDPGPVVLRRLNNAEYTYTIRDLTGVELGPAKEFPADGAAGEGFTNAGAALAMSDALLVRYLAAAKNVSRHAVLLPDGVRFSAGDLPNDWKNEALDRIRALYGRYADAEGATQVNLQGVVFETNGGGRLPIEKYLAALLERRDDLIAERTTTEALAKARSLSVKYLTSLWKLMNETDRSPLIGPLRKRFQSAKPSDAPALASEIRAWQQALVRFQAVGHLKPWMVPNEPLVARQEFRVPVPPTGAAALKLSSVDLGGGQAIVWERPRLTFADGSEWPLTDFLARTEPMLDFRKNALAAAAPALAAASEAVENASEPSLSTLAEKHGVKPDVLRAWFAFLGVVGGVAAPPALFANRVTKVGGYDFANGWSSGELPSVVANASDRHVRIPGNLKPHGFVVHPSSDKNVVIGWKSPVGGAVRVRGAILHAHPECGNGVSWTLERRRGAMRWTLASGVAHGGKPAEFGPIQTSGLRAGDLLALVVGPRDGNHSCDLADLDWRIESATDSTKNWNLAGDVSTNIHDGNPHADALGNRHVWHFFAEPTVANPPSSIPAGSSLANWQQAATPAERRKLAEEIANLLSNGPPQAADHPDAKLHRQLTALAGPLLGHGWKSVRPTKKTVAKSPLALNSQGDLPAAAPSVVAIDLPENLGSGVAFVVSGRVREPTGAVQLHVRADGSEPPTELTPNAPVIAAESGPARERWRRAFDEFRRRFPPALCYYKLVPVDEVITLTLFHREDEPLARLMLSDAESAELNRLWEELHFVAQDALTSVDAFHQLLEYASQDADPKVFEPYRKPIYDRAAAFRRTLAAAEPKHLAAVKRFAAEAYRRPLSDAEAAGFDELYRKLRGEKLAHDEAVRALLAKALTAPAFLYRLEKSPPNAKSAPVSAWELASRLSYFLWSSAPDDELRRVAADGTLLRPEILEAQTLRMLRRPKTRRLAAEFACQWLQLYDFDKIDEKSPRHFPTFAAVQADLKEEAVRYFADLFARDGSVLEAFDSDHAFLNANLARHYGVPNVDGADWRRVDGVRALGRGGVLGMGAVLARQSGASRTSPILRGNWISEVLLGEKLPRPPKDVPRLPEDEGDAGALSVRQLTEKHVSDARCSGCHRRIDPFGFALEGFDAVGRGRLADLANRPIVTKTRLPDGTTVANAEQLRRHLVGPKRDVLVRQFCRKLLGYALGRGVQLSDEPLLDDMTKSLAADGFRFHCAIRAIVHSKQFREIRGAAWLDEAN